MKKIAFFDFDGTITSRDTFIDFALFYKGKTGFVISFLKSIPSLIKWKLRIVSNSEAKQNLFNHLFKNESIESFNSKCQEFSIKIEEMLREDTMKRISEYRTQNIPVVIVTASISNWIYPWALKNGISKVLATEIEVNKEGFLTGNFSTPNCHGEEKVARIKTEYPNLEAYETYAFGDSKADIPMIQSCKFGQII